MTRLRRVVALLAIVGLGTLLSACVAPADPEVPCGAAWSACAPTPVGEPVSATIEGTNADNPDDTYGPMTVTGDQLQGLIEELEADWVGVDDSTGCEQDYDMSVRWRDEDDMADSLGGRLCASVGQSAAVFEWAAEQLDIPWTAP